MIFIDKIDNAIDALINYLVNQGSRNTSREIVIPMIITSLISLAAVILFFVGINRTNKKIAQLQVANARIE